MYLVHEYDRTLSETAIVFRLLHDLLDFLDAAGDCGKVDERRSSMVRDDARERGFAHAGRPPEDHRADAVAFNQAAQHLARPKQVGLPSEFGELLRPQPRRERTGIVPAEKCLLLHSASPFRLVMILWYCRCLACSGAGRSVAIIPPNKCSCKEDVKNPL